jgi:hypothetical protein
MGDNKVTGGSVSRQRLENQKDIKTFQQQLRDTNNKPSNSGHAKANNDYLTGQITNPNGPFTGSLKQLEARVNSIVNNPKATPEQKQIARAAFDDLRQNFPILNNGGLTSSQATLLQKADPVLVGTRSFTGESPRLSQRLILAEKKEIYPDRVFISLADSLRNVGGRGVTPKEGLAEDVSKAVDKITRSVQTIQILEKDLQGGSANLATRSATVGSFSVSPRIRTNLPLEDKLNQMHLKLAALPDNDPQKLPLLNQGGVI